MNLLVKLLLLAILATFPVSGMAQEVGQGLICDTEAQLREVARLAAETRNLEASIAKVNGSENLCGVVPVAYLMGDRVATIDTMDGKRDIVRIIVIGVLTPEGMMHVPPLPQYTLFKAKGEDV